MKTQNVKRLFHTVTKGRSKALGLELLTLLEEQDNVPDPKLNEEDVLDLIHRGADLSLVSAEFQNTALSLAVMFHSFYNLIGFDVIKEMVERGADVNHTNTVSTVLGCAAGRPKRASLCKYLLDHGADINKQNPRGETPLHIAALFNKTEYVSMFVKRGARLDIEDNKGQTPYVFLKNHEYQWTEYNVETMKYFHQGVEKDIKEYKGQMKKEMGRKAIAGLNRDVRPKSFKGFKRK